jgi:hypothetical protein
MDNTVEPHQFFGLTFGVSSFAGLAASLRANKKLTAWAVATAMLNSGLFGLGLALVWVQNFTVPDNGAFVIGVCVFAGLGGNTMLDFALELVKKTISAAAASAVKRGGDDE